MFGDEVNPLRNPCRESYDVVRVNPVRSIGAGTGDWLDAHGHNTNIARTTAKNDIDRIIDGSLI